MPSKVMLERPMPLLIGTSTSLRSRQPFRLFPVRWTETPEERHDRSLKPQETLLDGPQSLPGYSVPKNKDSCLRRIIAVWGGHAESMDGGFALEALKDGLNRLNRGLVGRVRADAVKEALGRKDA